MIKRVPHVNTNQPRLLSVALCLCIALLSSSCNKLTKACASEIIRDTYGFPIARTELFQYGEINYSRHFGGSNMREHKYLAENGLITFEYQGVKKDPAFIYESYHLEMTPHGHEYIVNETGTPDGRRFYYMKTADGKFNAVTEIHPLSDTSDTSIKVEFSWSYINITPFGVASNLRVRSNNDMCGVSFTGDEYDEEWIFDETVVFIKDDGGWTIQPPLVLRSGLIRVESPE